MAPPKVAVFVRYPRRTGSGSEFCVFEQWDEAQPWNYWRSRYELKKLMLFAERKPGGVEVGHIGYKLSPEDYEALTAHRILPVEIFGGTHRPGRNVWCPDDYISKGYDVCKEVDELPDVERAFEQELSAMLQI
jgi:hypothetical protein